MKNGTPGPGPDIIARNLTPDKTGLPAGGLTFADFLAVMRNGTDFDHAHLNCSSSITNNCYAPPTDGALLQVMPWPTFDHMTDRQLLAIWAYLSALPCIDNTTSVGPAGSSDLLHNDCPK